MWHPATARWRYLRYGHVLRPREREAYKLVYGLHNGYRHKLREAAPLMGVSMTRVRQLRCTAERRIRREILRYYGFPVDDTHRMLALRAARW